MFCHSPPYILKKNVLSSNVISEINKRILEVGQDITGQEAATGSEKQAQVISVMGFTLESFYQNFLSEVKYQNRNSYGFDLHDEQLSSLQFTIYDSEKGGKYGPHRDVATSIFHDMKLTAIFNMSDEPYLGGDFIIHDRKDDQTGNIQFDSGDLIIFPSSYMHEVTQVIKGVRKSLTMFVTGPCWR